MKARLLSESDTRQETAPEENAKEYTKKRPNDEKEENPGWWDEFNGPTKARVMVNRSYSME